MANKSVQQRSAWGKALLALTGTISLLWASSALGQEKLKTPKDFKAIRLNSLVRDGYTRPGNPDDKIGKNGAILQVAHDPGYKGKVLGGTVYFAVFERLANPVDGDVWGTGLGRLTNNFIEGRSFQNGVSDALNVKSKYLYLYQIVNDRGLDPNPGGVAFAATNDLATSEIASFSLRLVVDPRYITSWGHFKDVGFTVVAPDRSIKGDVRASADGAESKIRMAVSSNPSVLAELPSKRFLRHSPAYTLGELGSTLGLGLSNLGLKDSLNGGLIAKKMTAKADLFHWESNVAAVTDKGAKEPQFVQLLTFAADDRLVSGVAVDDLARHVFRVDWKAGNHIKTGQHSVIFGFTSDLPPRDEPVRIDDAQAALKTELIRAVGVGMVEGVGAAAGVGVAVGIAPSPSVFVDEGFQVAGDGFGGGFGGGYGGGFGGAGGLGGGWGGGWGAGGFGAARPIANGGGGGGGSGNGQGDTTGQQAQDQRGNQTLNFNATLINQQAQQQQQWQSQSQTQTNNNNNNCCCDHDGQVIPAPGALVLGLIGLPALLVWRRRFKMTPEAQPDVVV